MRSKTDVLKILQFSRLGFVSLGPLHCAWNYLRLCSCILFLLFSVLYICGGIDCEVDLVELIHVIMRSLSSFSVLTLLVNGYLTRKTRPRYDL